jgi:hypothetical protein
VVLIACRGWSAGAGLSVALTLLLRLGRSGALVEALSPDGVPLRLGDLGIGAPLCLLQLGAVREARAVFLAQQRKAQRDSNSVAHLCSEGDAAGGVLWAVALYYCSPLQLLLLFLGRFETARPSDRVLRLLGRAAGLRRACARRSLMNTSEPALHHGRAAKCASSHSLSYPSTQFPTLMPHTMSACALHGARLNMQ